MLHSGTTLALPTGCDFLREPYMSRPKPVSVRPLPVAGEKAFYRLGVILMTIGVLYWAQTVLLPLALAILFAFALTPVAGWLERRRLGRVPSALLSTGGAIALLAGILWSRSGRPSA